MKMRTLFALSVSLIAASTLLADRKAGTANDFQKVEEFTQNQTPSRAFREATLERNLTNALRSSLVRKYIVKEREELMKDLKMGNMSFEQEKNTYNYYVKFGSMVIFYNFDSNPELYLQTPVSFKIYASVAEQELERGKAQERQDKSQTFSSGSGDDDSKAGGSDNDKKDKSKNVD